MNTINHLLNQVKHLQTPEEYVGVTFPGDPLFIQVYSLEKFEKFEERRVKTPFDKWMFMAKVVYLINLKGKFRLMKDVRGETGMKLNHIGDLNELFTTEEMLTHNQPPVRKWGKIYAGRRN